MDNVKLLKLAKRVVAILDKKCKSGCRPEKSSWIGFENGNGRECGKDIEALISAAKRIIKKHNI